MVCSEKELGITEEHEGIIILDDDAPVGMPLADYMGDAVLDISILPNMARNANVIGVARELAALTRRELKKPTIKFKTDGESIEELVSIEITESRTQFALCAWIDSQCGDQAQSISNPAPTQTGGHASDQQHCGRDQLRHARTRRAASCL